VAAAGASPVATSARGVVAAMRRDIVDLDSSMAED